MNLDFNNMIAYVAAVIFLFIFAKIFIQPIKVVLKLVKLRFQSDILLSLA